MIEFDYEEKELRLKKYLHPIPTEWEYYVISCLSEIDSLLSNYSMNLDDIEILDMKEKYGDLRIYICIKKLSDEDLSDSDYRFYSHIDNLLSCIITRWEKEVKFLTKQGILPKF